MRTFQFLAIATSNGYCIGSGYRLPIAPNLAN